MASESITDFETPPRATRLWIPDDLSTIRGLIVIGNPFGGDARHYIDNQALRGFATLFGFGLMTTAFWQRFQDNEIDIWDEHLMAHGNLSNHPEIINAPYVFSGFSNGGQMAYGMNALRPHRMIGFCVNKGGYYILPYPSDEAILTPGLLIAGAQDEEFRRTAIHHLFIDNRPRGARWAWVEEQGMGHEGDAERIILPFLADCIVARYPPDLKPSATKDVQLLELAETSGWLADPSTWINDLTVIMPYSEYSGDPNLACWLPAASSAYNYRAFATRTPWISVSGGIILDRPRFLELPGFHDYWTTYPGIAPCSLGVQIDLSDDPEWSYVQFYRGDVELGQWTRDSSPEQTLSVILSLPNGVHSISAIVTGSDGTTRTTSDQRHVIVLEQNSTITTPELSQIGVLTLMVALSFLFVSRNRQ